MTANPWDPDTWRTAVGLVVQLSRGHGFEADSIIAAALADGSAAALLEALGWLSLGLAGTATGLENDALEALLLSHAASLRDPS